MVTPSSHKSSAKPPIGAMIVGVLIALLGFAAATAQGMATAPSAVAAIIAMAVIVLGCALAALAIASIWLPRLRQLARACSTALLGLLVVAFVINRVLIIAG